jgi:hypothetical protein
MILIDAFLSALRCGTEERCPKALSCPAFACRAALLRLSSLLPFDAMKRVPSAYTEDENRHDRFALMGTAKWTEQERKPEQQPSAWMQAHQALSRLARERAAADAEEGRWLLAALRSATHVHLGFGSFSEYVERSFGYKPRSTQEKLRVAEALEGLPLLAQALERGAVHWSAARELTRVAVAENEREWLTVADGKSVRQLEELVAGKVPGDDPSSPARPSERRHVLRFEVAPETFASFREALTALRRSTGGALDDDAALLALARLALGGPRDEGRASYQIAVTVCAACGHGQQLASGELVPIGLQIVEMAHCDGQHLGRVAPHAANDSTPMDSTTPGNDAHLDCVAPQVANDNAPPDSPGPNEDAHGATLRAEHERGCVPVSANLRAHERNYVPRAHVGAQVPLEPTAGSAFPRATQTIPPALRRTVLARDYRRCRVPGCRNSAFLDVHHIELRSEGGRNDVKNLITLCGAHHRAAHRGQLVIEGTSATLRVRHADGSLYGRVQDPLALQARAKTFSALRNLGFREGDVRAALAQLENEGKLTAATIEQWIRAGLARLTRSRSRR